VCGAIFGIVPAVRFARTDAQGNLRATSQTIAGERGHLRDWLVGGEVAISAVLLMLAGLLTGSMWKLLHVDRGFTADNAIAVRLESAARFKDSNGASRVIDRALEAVRGIPGVSSAAFIAGLPLTGESMVNGVDVEGTDHDAVDPTTRQAILVNVRFISSDYFRTMGIAVVKGRSIEGADGERKVAVISERLAAKLWPKRDPLGHTLRTGSQVGKVEVVGVARDVYNARLDADPTLVIYVPSRLRGYLEGDIVMRTALSSSALMPEVQRRLWALDRDMPIPASRTIAQIVSESTAQRRMQMEIAAGFALSALILAALGIYGVTAFNAARRRREIGIRLALGARAGEVRRLMVASGLRPVMAGLVVGLAAALALGRLVRSLLYQVSSADPVVIAAVAIGLLTIAFAACALPARAAASLDPARVLRDE
jgi:putative ABC transport system permease protein